MVHVRKHLKISVLVMAFLLCFSFICAASSDVQNTSGDVFEFSVSPERSEYAAGEQIVFKSQIQNTTAEKIENVMVIADVPETGTYLTRGVSELSYNAIEPGDIKTGDFKFSEYEAVVKIGTVIAALSATIGAIYIFFVNKYNYLASVFLTVSLIFTTAFAAAPGSLSHLAAIRDRQELGSCKVVYDGQEYEFSFHATYEKKLCKTQYIAAKHETALGETAVCGEVKESENAFAGIIFASSIEKSDFNGYVFFIDPSAGAAGVMLKEGSVFTAVAKKNVSIEKDKTYKIKVMTDGQTARCYLYNNPLDEDPYPLFDIPVTPKGNDIGTYASKTGEVSITDVAPCSFTYTGETYTNPVLKDCADPYVLTYDNMYYLYSTTIAWEGFEVYTSDDLVNWTYGGVVATKGELLGGGNYWAPEVYNYNGQFYMFYTADEHTAVAVADSPYGPFRRTSDDFFFDFSAIDSSLFFDDDGRIFMYFSKMLHSEGEGQQIWGCELNSDLLSYKEGTLTHLTSPNKEWEDWVNEGPFMLKHNGTYYLTYSGNFYFNINYGSAYAISDSPLGTFEKYENNPIAQADTFIHATGHHAFVYSPDGSELFMIYHCHNSTESSNGRSICIDRVKFVPYENTADILTLYGPTVTAQPVASK